MLGSIIGAASSLLGGFMQSKENKKQYEHQKEFAKSGIQWKVEDAEKAGIHPLYAMGAQTTSYQPTQAGDFGIPDAGQNIGRAIDATRSSPEQKAALAITAAQIEGLNLDNELKRTQLASTQALVNQTGPKPGLPGLFDNFALAGQGDSGVVTSVPPGHKAVPPEYTSPEAAMFGHKWKRTGDHSDAQTWENMYGDESPFVWMLNQSQFLRDLWANTNPAYQKHVIEKLRR